MGVAGIAVLGGLLILGTPVAFALLSVGLAGLTLLTSAQVALPAFTRAVDGAFSTHAFTVIPMFLLMGEVASASGLSQGLYRVADQWLRRLPGGLGLATIGACAGFSAICGSSVATAATLGRVALPEMSRHGIHPRFATGVVAAGGTLGFLIPPSIGFVVYGILTEQSIGHLLMAGVVPGLLLTVAYGLIAVAWAARHPDEIPSDRRPAPMAERMASLRAVWELPVVFGLVMGGIYRGVFTATEAGAAGAGFLLLMALVRRRISRRQLGEAFSSTIRHSVMILLIVAGANLFTTFMALTLIPSSVAAWVGGLPFSRYVILAVILVGYLVLGCFLDATSMMVLTLPVTFPVILSLNFDPVWFGVVSVLMMEAGLITPPLGLNVFVIAAVSDVPMETVFRGAAVFLVGILAVALLVTVWPELALFLPAAMRRF